MWQKGACKLPTLDRKGVIQTSSAIHTHRLFLEYKSAASEVTSPSENLNLQKTAPSVSHPFMADRNSISTGIKK